MATRRGEWALAGVGAGAAGLAVSYFVAGGLSVRQSPVSAVATVVVDHTPGPVAEKAISLLGHGDKPFLVAVVVVLSVAILAGAGVLARRSWIGPLAVYASLAVVGGLAVASQHGATDVDVVPVVAGLLTWPTVLALLVAPLRRAGRALDIAEELETERPRREAAYAVVASSRRGFLLRAAIAGAGAAALGVAGRVVGRGRRQVEAARRLLKISQVTEPVVPAGTSLGVDGVTRWETPADDFYRIDTAIVTPTILPEDWSLRIHGMVDREVRLSFDDLVGRELTEAWVTIGCVSNEIGGHLVGNAWWSGVRIAPLLAEAGVQEGADAIKQTSSDGWTCGTPLEVLTDDRNAMLAVAMNGEPLPIEHGFPVRTIVPGLYGYVSACKWVEDIEVTRFDRFEAFWTRNGWSERGPVKIASRIDVAEATGATARLAGMAWAQHTGISKVEVAIDGGAWTAVTLGAVPSVDTWVQWTTVLEGLTGGDHTARVRATDGEGNLQIAAFQGTVPDGATGLHSRRFHVSG